MISSDLSSKILKESLNQQKEILHEDEEEAHTNFPPFSQVADSDSEEKSDDECYNFDGLLESLSLHDLGVEEIKEEDEAALVAFFGSNAGPQLTLDDIIISKIKEKGVQASSEEADDSFYVFKGHTDELYTVACSPTDASLVATGGKDDRGYLWKVGSQDPGLELKGHRDTVSTLAFSFDGQLLATGGFDGLIQVWDVNLGSIKCTLENSGGGVEWLKWHPKGHLILAGSEDSGVWLWNADESAILNTFYGHASSVTCGDFSPDGKIICTGSDDASLMIWKPKNGVSIIVRGYPYHTDGLTCLSITDDSTMALTGSKDSSINMVSLATGKVLSSLVSHSDTVECLGVSPGSHWAATGSLDQKLIIWDVERSFPRCTCNHDYGVTCLLWLGSSRFVATGSIDGKVRIWDSLSGSCVRSFSGHVNVVQSLAVSADLSSLVSVSNDGTARVFNISEFR